MSNSNIDRARAWLRNTPGAVSGQGGHNTTFAVATALVHGFELSHGEAETLLHEYNAKCLPPWKPNDLVHKLNEAFRVSHDKPKGWLLSAQSGTPVSTTGKFIVQKIQAIPQPECRFTTIDFLKACFEPDETVCICNDIICDEDGKVIIVRFGDPNMEIKRDNPERRKNFRARHNCAEAKDKTTPKFWSCKAW